MDELQNQIENSNSRLYCLALFFSTLYIIRSATLWEPFADFAEIFRYFAWLFCSLILLFSISKYNSNQHVLIICVVLLSLFVGENCNRLDFMYFSSALIIGAKDIIEQTDLSDSTVRRILRKFLQDKKIETTDNNEKSPNKKYKLTE